MGRRSAFVPKWEAALTANLWRPLFKIIENFKMAAPHTKLSMGPFYTMDPAMVMNPESWPLWRIWWYITMSSLVL